jgi:hypothetical protein
MKPFLRLWSDWPYRCTLFLALVWMIIVVIKTQEEIVHCNVGCMKFGKMHTRRNVVDANDF